MKSSSSHIVCPALQSLLSVQLQKALTKISLDLSLASGTLADGTLASGALGLEQAGSTYSSLNNSLIDIPLNQVKDLTQVKYVSAIAFKLAKPWDMQTMELAQAIATEWHDLTKKAGAMFDQLPLDRVGQNFDVQTALPGWIYLRLKDEGLAIWLQILNKPLNLRGDRTRFHFENNNQFFSNSTNLFEIQHNHARCCTLLRLAAQTGIISLTPSLQQDCLADNAWYIAEPNPIPWLEPDQRLRLSHPLEHRLIAQSVTVLDELASHPSPSPARVLKLAQSLSQTFQAFEASCQIWGEVLSTHPELAQARLGLVTMTQSILQWMLKDWLAVEAPVEL